METKKTGKLFLHIMLPLAGGALIYYVQSPDVWFVKQVDAVFGVHFFRTQFLERHIPQGQWIVKLVRNYLLDMMWGYALMFALFFVSGNNRAALKKNFLTAFVFSAVIEFLQITPWIYGTFDWWDLLAEFLAEAAAYFIIKKDDTKNTFEEDK